MRHVYSLALNQNLKKVLFFLTLGLVAFLPSFVFADHCKGGVRHNAAGECDVFGTTEIEDTTALGTADLQTTVTRIINVALSLLGIVAVVIILIGGFEWMTAGGSEDKVETAKKRIMYGIIGLAIILSAWAITKFVLNALGDATRVNNFREIQ